jgi:hypothetical protein
MRMKSVLALLLVPLFAVTILLPIAPVHAIIVGKEQVTLNNGFATFMANDTGFISYQNAYINPAPSSRGYIFLWYWAVNFTYMGTHAVYSYEDSKFTSVGWFPDGKGYAASLCTASCNLVVDEKVASVPGSDALVWGIRLINPTANPITNVKFYGYQDGDFQGTDEGHFTTLNLGPLHFMGYEDHGNTPASRMTAPYIGYTFAGLAADAHDLNPSYSGGYSDVTSNVMNGANYYLSDGATISRYTFGTLAPGASVVIYLVLGMSPGITGPIGLEGQLLLGSAMASSLANPPTFIT